MFDFLNRITGPWTLLWSMALAAVGALQAFDWATVVPPGWEGVALAAVGLITAVVRRFDPEKPPAGAGIGRA